MIGTVKQLKLIRDNKRFSIQEKVDNPDDFKRFKITETGVSLRTLPGTKNGMHFTGSSEHTEGGVSIASTKAGLPQTLPIREAMVQKRDRKLQYLKKELPVPKLEGTKDADVTLVSWGATYTIVKEARLLLENQNITTNRVGGGSKKDKNENNSSCA